MCLLRLLLSNWLPEIQNSISDPTPIFSEVSPSKNCRERGRSQTHLFLRSKATEIVRNHNKNECLLFHSSCMFNYNLSRCLGGINRHGLLFHAQLYRFIFIFFGDLIIVVIIILIFRLPGVAKEKNTRNIHSLPSQLPRKSRARRSCRKLDSALTEALSFCPASLMLPYPQFSDRFLSPFYFIFIFGEGKKELSSSQLSVGDLLGCLGFVF